VLSLQFCIRRYPDCAFLAVLNGLWQMPPSKPYIYSSGEAVHCTENPTYVFPEMKLRGLVPNSYLHVSVSYFYFQDRSAHLAAAKKGRPMLGIYKSLTDT
jgi:hypothetical protein